jgi:hypothetical protein
MVIVNSCNCISEASRTLYVDRMVISIFKKKACRGPGVDPCGVDDWQLEAEYQASSLYYGRNLRVYNKSLSRES